MIEDLRRLRDELERLDVATYEAVARTETPALDRFMRALSTAADYSRLSLAAAAVLAATGGADGRRAAGRGLASVAVTATVVNVLLKPLLRRRRPERAEAAPNRHIPMPVSRSFPSGHSAAAFAFATGAGAVMPETGPPLYALATVVAYSRVHTGVHYPLDVIAGALCGVTLSAVTVRALDSRTNG